jgi:hypothetical protein
MIEISASKMILLLLALPFILLAGFIVLRIVKSKHAEPDKSIRAYRAFRDTLQSKPVEK